MLNVKLINKIFNHIIALNKTNWVEVYGSYVDYNEVNAILNGEIDEETYLKEYLKKNGRSATEMILHRLSTEDLNFEKMLFQDYRVMDAYHSCYFKFDGQEYYLFNNYDAGFNEDIDSVAEQWKGVLTDVLLFSVVDQCFYVFMVTHENDQYHLKYFQQSEKFPGLVPFIRNRDLFSKRGYYWYPTQSIVDICCTKEILQLLNEESPAKYNDWVSGTRLQVNLHATNLPTNLGD